MEPPSRAKGFTLVELLVVIGIIAVLIAILMPVLARARQQALRIQCAANLHSLSQALALYVQQQGYYPLAIRRGPAMYYAAWPVELWRLSGQSRSVFNCPARDESYWWTPETPSQWYFGIPQHGDEPQFYVRDGSVPFCYGYNIGGTDKATLQRGLGATTPGPWVSQVRVGAVRCASDMIAITDSADWHGPELSFIPDCFDVVPWQWTVIGSVSRSLYPPAPVHFDGANVLFCDGHVQPLPRKELSNIEGGSAAQTAARRRWNSDHEP